MATNIFVDNTKSLPKSDAQIVRISMKENEIAGRKDHVPTPSMGRDMAIQHVPNAGSQH
jgi:hypothetical protein